jgi:cytochrome c oxidase assembly protein subunit 11
MHRGLFLSLPETILLRQVSPYFAKVECFCFEQQKIRAGEQVDLPVFFFIDKDILDDPSAEQVDDMVLSYTFFKSASRTVSCR